MYLMYLRVANASGLPGADEKEILSVYEEKLQEYATRRLGGHIAEENIYRDIAPASPNYERPGLRKLLSRTEEESVEGVLTLSLDRLIRDVLTDLKNPDAVIYTLARNNTKVIMPNWVFDLNDGFHLDMLQVTSQRVADDLKDMKHAMAQSRGGRK